MNRSKFRLFTRVKTPSPLNTKHCYIPFVSHWKFQTLSYFYSKKYIKIKCKNPTEKKKKLFNMFLYKTQLINQNTLEEFLSALTVYITCSAE